MAWQNSDSTRISAHGSEPEELESRLKVFLSRIGDALRNKPRARSFAVYLTGLLSNIGRKTAEAIAVAAVPDTPFSAVRTSPKDGGAFREVTRCHQSLLHTIGKAKWDDHAVRDEAARFGLDSLPEGEHIEQLIIDDTGWIKQGAHSVGVKRQYTGSAGKITNCQVGVSVVACTATSQFPVDFSLYLPKEWLTKQARASARIPNEVSFRTKPELAVDMIDRILDSGLMPVCRVSADSAYGDSAAFRAAMTEHGCSLAVGVKGKTQAWSVDACGSRRGPSTSVAAIAARLKYRKVVWRNGSKGKMAGRFGARRIIVTRDFRKDEEENEPLWLVAEKAADSVKFHLVTGAPNAKLKDLVIVLKQRFRTERAYQDAKNEVGLDHYQGRSFVGWHHHVTAAICACAFLFSEHQRVPRTPNAVSRRNAVRTSTRLLRHFPESFPTMRRLIASIVGFILPRHTRLCQA